MLRSSFSELTLDCIWSRKKGEQILRIAYAEVTGITRGSSQLWDIWVPTDKRLECPARIRTKAF